MKGKMVFFKQRKEEISRKAISNLIVTFEAIIIYLVCRYTTQIYQTDTKYFIL